MNFAAHIRKDKYGNETEQSVFSHLTGTADKSSFFGNKAGISCVCEIQGLLHDAGKLSTAFNDYIHNNTNLKRGSIDHSYAGAKYLYETALETGDSFLIFVSRIIGHTIISHHGLHNWVTLDGEDYFEYRVSKSDNYAEIFAELSKYLPRAELLSKLRVAADEYRVLFNKILKLSKQQTYVQESGAYYFGCLERLLQSILIDADRTDTAEFTYSCCLNRSVSVSWLEMRKNIESRLEEFAELTDPISLRRMKISSQCRDFALTSTANLCRLIVPTGGGKTLSSMRFAVETCIKQNKDRIFYIAPFMSILEQNSDVIRDIAGDSSFLEHHSNFLSGDESCSELHNYYLKAERWTAPVIATTFVQFLNTLFSDNLSSVRRLHQLCNSVIIIDEVQQIPLKFISMFNLMINFLSNVCGCTIVLCSATQPVFDKTHFPLLYGEELRDIVSDYESDFEIFSRTEVIPLLNGSYTYTHAANFCVKHLKDTGDSILFIVNTKKSAQVLYRLIQGKVSEDVHVFHLSTNMCPQHRRDVLNAVRTCLSLKQRVICVSTQLIEAGVDISFGCVIRALAGLDSIAQASGRCNRHNEYKKLCPVFVLDLIQESFEYMPQLIEARAITKQIFMSSEFRGKYLSPETLERYFSKYFAVEKSVFNCPLSDLHVSMFELLSTNQSSWSLLRKSELRYNSHAFKTAGSYFEVIPGGTKDVVIPYNEEALAVIEKFASTEDILELSVLSRKLQKYTISIYNTVFEELASKETFVFMNNDLTVLKPEFFDANLGYSIN